MKKRHYLLAIAGTFAILFLISEVDKLAFGKLGNQIENRKGY
jgi:hypothetical protein